jgi:ABC-type ATPase with predicted acetyltransferase domain
MQTYTANKQFPWTGRLSEKVVSVMKMFGLDTEKLINHPHRYQLSIQLGPGQICYLTGPSGAGKSVLLKSIYDNCDPAQSLWLDDITLESDKSLIDCIEGDFFGALNTLSKAGLSEAFAILNQPANLSLGQQYRYRLARAAVSTKKLIFADEFCSSLDRISAALVAHKIKKLARETGKRFFLASSHDDLLCDLTPDVIVIKHLSAPAEVIYRDSKTQNRFGS